MLLFRASNIASAPTDYYHRPVGHKLAGRGAARHIIDGRYRRASSAMPAPSRTCLPASSCALHGGTFLLAVELTNKHPIPAIISCIELAIGAAAWSWTLSGAAPVQYGRTAGIASRKGVPCPAGG